MKFSTLKTPYQVTWSKQYYGYHDVIVTLGSLQMTSVKLEFNKKISQTALQKEDLELSALRYIYTSFLVWKIVFKSMMTS